MEARKEAVLFTDNFHRLMKYLDHVIYSKKKLEREGRRRRDVAKVFLNKTHIDDLDNQKDYVSMKKSKQPQKPCEIAKKATEYLYNVYS